MCGILFINNRDISPAELHDVYKLLEPRGPDDGNVYNYKKTTSLFRRLSINDQLPSGMQPFVTENYIFMCNGEIYNHVFLQDKFKYDLKGKSDCEIIPHIIKEFGIKKALSFLEGVFAFIYYDKKTEEFIIARDRIGIKPLYVSYNNGETIVSSDLKTIHALCDNCQVFAPCHFYDSSTGEMSPYDIMNFDKLPYLSLTSNDIKTKINQLIKEAVKIRCETTERPFGCFLSGGLDSSLVAAIVSKHVPGKLKTFSVGLQNATDLIAAKQVADYIGSDHHELILTESEMLDAIPGVIQQIESYDVTTVRASTPMVLLSRWIKQNTDVTVLFSGEGADELSGSYRYFDKSPNPLETQRECTRLLNDLHLFDVLRCDKSVSGCGLEPRVPFLDFNFVNFYMRIDPVLKSNKQIEKKLLRESFEDDNLLPSSILYRKKEAFSDGCSSRDKSWYEIIRDYCETIIDDNEYLNHSLEHIQPLSKEAFWYRTLFENYYPNKGYLVPYYWTQKWTGSDNAPISARELD